MGGCTSVSPVAGGGYCGSPVTGGWYCRLSASGGTFFNAFKPFHPPKFEVKEVFGELELPIFRDVPFFQELTVSGAARYSDYNTPADKTFAWNVGGTYAPIRDLRFPRGQ